jgi:putative transposase
VKIIQTTKLKIISHTKSLEPTIEIYNKALLFYINVILKEWNLIKNLKSHEQLKILERLTHKTKNNLNPKYNFDKDFYKFPSYLRRACIMEAIGHYLSWDSNYKRWLKEKEEALLKSKKFYKKAPTLNIAPKSFPVFYKKEMFKHLKEGIAKIKAYIDNDWKWIEIKYNTKNLYSSGKPRFLGYKELNPTLIRKGKKYFLHIPYEKQVKLNSTPLDKQIAIGVDLGLTNTAVISAITSSGTVIGRKFINQPIEKDRLKKKLNKLAKVKRLSGLIKTPNYWRKINNFQKAITQKTADEIINFALKYNANVIVFEFLNNFKLPKNFYGAKRLRAKLQHWAKARIQKLVIQKAHRYGIRVKFVSPKGTSKYAFDGSGEVIRNSKKDICRFKNGKTYHADLNASYNIGARYFIREYLKPLSEMARLQAEAKVPLFADRASHSLASLIRLAEVIEELPLNTSLSCIQVKEAPAITESLAG